MKLAGAYIHDEKYEQLVALGKLHNRTLAGECRHIFDRALRGELQVPNAPPPPPQIITPRKRSSRGNRKMKTL